MTSGMCVRCGGLIVAFQKESVAREKARQLSDQAGYPVIYRMVKGIVLCGVCLDALPLIGHDICERCGRDRELQAGINNVGLCRDCVHGEDSENLVANRSLLRYEKGERDLLGLFKYRGDERLASYYGTLLAITVQRYYRSMGFTCITTVPLHSQRLRERGFNQVDLLARHLGAAIKIPAKQLLLRTKDTPKLSKQKGRAARHESMREAFVWDGQEFPSASKILLLDDIYTTGSTLRSCARTIREHLGPSCEIYSLTIYR
ncbi:MULTISPECIES: ComF family protein [Brevibacillus]|uniref:ComF family protein n=1 Tax=Brevibacillus TaxID=55080 RepID=UPI000D0F70A5|nr:MULTISPECIES: ComF family protein [Brevibacillus]MED1944708.1 ComF family protein [Brevibacillus formosus]MED1996605.1 ComF family protein [Brevibacillus formosus]MED2081574.1 ComF family protein [Brevibacillus formosus]PSK19974.1 ComF family protein [Brevibacillus sp. NRRL NRS-603]